MCLTISVSTSPSSPPPPSQPPPPVSYFVHVPLNLPVPLPLDAPCQCPAPRLQVSWTPAVPASQRRRAGENCYPSIIRAVEPVTVRTCAGRKRGVSTLLSIVTQPVYCMLTVPLLSPALYVSLVLSLLAGINVWKEDRRLY